MTADSAPETHEVAAGRLWYPVRPEQRFDLGGPFGGPWYTSLPLRTYEPRELLVEAFEIDRYPVTNGEFDRFLRESGYRPDDAHNFLRHWQGSRCPPEFADHPVVWVSLADARAYASWTGKRLPTDAEWQLAGQGTDGRPWPWGEAFEPARCNVHGPGTTPVDAFPAGRSIFGVEDLVGNVWELTDSEGFDGAHRSCHLRGGSYYNVRHFSHWFGPSGPLELYHHRKLLLLSPGFDRYATIGFRCCRGPNRRSTEEVATA